MFTCVLSGVQDLASFQHSEKKTMTMVSAFKLFVAWVLYEYVTRADTDGQEICFKFYDSES